METNRAAAVAMKAEVRRTKARLLEEVPKLQKLARKKVILFHNCMVSHCFIYYFSELHAGAIFEISDLWIRDQIIYYILEFRLRGQN